MVDKIDKALNKLSDKGRKAIKQILSQIRISEFAGLDIKKLKQRNDIYRVRKGTLRIIFQKTSARIHILTLERGSDTTYSDS
jgi:mRNA-degrading endonuclease RelE of RelBE toxin-antitoxin system